MPDHDTNVVWCVQKDIKEKGEDKLTEKWSHKAFVYC